MHEGHDLGFWLTVFGATIIKVVTSTNQSIIKTLTGGFAAIFAAWVFTDPIIHYLAISSDTYTTPVAALLALTGEGLMRAIMGASEDPTKLVSIIKAWRGK